MNRTIVKGRESFDEKNKIYYVNVYPNKYIDGVEYGFISTKRETANNLMLPNCLYRIVIRRK